MSVRRTKSCYADNRAVDDFRCVVEQIGIPKPSAFDVAMEETARNEKAAWDAVVRDLIPLFLRNPAHNSPPESKFGLSYSGANVADGADLNAKFLGLLTNA